MGEDGGDGEAAGALDVHEEGAWAGDEGLQLVLAGLSLRRWVEKIDGENHICGVVMVIGVESRSSMGLTGSW